MLSHTQDLQIPGPLLSRSYSFTRELCYLSPFLSGHSEHVQVRAASGGVMDRDAAGAGEEAQRVIK